jgi:hypothetical protein
MLKTNSGTDFTSPGNNHQSYYFSLKNGPVLNVFTAQSTVNV